LKLGLEGLKLGTMEKFFGSLPKPILAGLAILLGLIVFILSDPPHTVCDVQKENLREELKGQIFASSANDKEKHRLPGILGRAQEGCQEGNSAGSCFEYFSILKKVARTIQNYSSECRTELSSITEIKRAMTDGVTLMAKMSWGSHPPEPGMNRVGWMQESELVLFCQLKNIYSLSFGSEAWDELRLKIYKEFPGEPPKNTKNPTEEEVPRAMTTMDDKEIWARSIFSIRCENYR
jgi:hypothetical protein